MSAHTIRPISLLNLAALIAVSVVQIILLAIPAHAAGLTLAMVRPDRLASSTTTGGMVCAKSTTADVETLVKVTFPTGFSTVDTPGNWTVNTSNIPADATAWIGIGTASAATGQDVTFPSGDMVVGTLYCFNFIGTSTLTTHATPGNDYTGTITTQKAGPTDIDTSSYALSIVGAGADQIVVTAAVPATFSFALSGNTDAFTTNLSSSSVVSTTGRTVSIGTNAAAGWVAWVKSANAALNSASTGASIATAGSVDNAPSNLNPTVGYVLDVDITTDSGTGTGTVTQASNYGAEYNGTSAEEGGTLSTNFQPIAASNGTTGGDVLTLTERAFISAVQAAATDYTDTLTIVAAGRF